MPSGPVVFFHAHPDDEAIFTGGTTALLAGEGPVVVLATNGEGGVPDPSSVTDLASHRIAEARAAADHLKCDVRFLGYQDSGMHAEVADGFAHADVTGPAERLAQILREVGASALVSYDQHGIYGHPDHVQVYRVGQRACELADVATHYLSTVDREYLHFVETHVVALADRATTDRATTEQESARPIGSTTVEIDLTVDVRGVVAAKRQAMAAHASQLPAGCHALSLGQAEFEAVYGWEWFLRVGPPGRLDRFS